MLGRIMAHEWKLLTREKLLYVALPIYALLLAYGVLTGTHWKNFLVHNVHSAVQLADNKFAKIDQSVEKIRRGEQITVDEDPRFPARMARYQAYEMAAKPPDATAAVSIGQSDLQPSYLRVQWAPMFQQANTDEIENASNLAVGVIDLGFVLIYLYPLLIIALSYNILSSERENGTQVLLLSQPVTVGDFVLGKVLLRGFIVIGLAVVMSVGGLLMGSPEIVEHGELWRLGLFAAVIVAYGVFWFGLAIIVNAFRNKSSANALILMSVWLAFVLIVPASLSLAAKTLYPLPSRVEMTQALRRGDAEVKKEVDYQRPYYKELLGRSTETALETTIGDFYLQLLPLEQRAEQIASPIFKQFDAQRSLQQKLAERLEFLSPAVLTQFSLHEIASNSAADFSDFNRQIENYHEVWRNYFLPIVLAKRRMTDEEVLGVPRFKYEPPAEGQVLGRVMGNLGALLVFALISMIAGFWLLRGYQPGAR